MPITNSSNKEVLYELNEILKEWESQHSQVSFNPTPTLKKLCVLFERETTIFLKQDPDPFDDRHPVTSNPKCALGECLRALFRRNEFVSKLVSNYLRDNYFDNDLLGGNSNTVDLNTTACRLILDLLYGLDVPQVFGDEEFRVDKLLQWAENGGEEICYYSTGLLASAMDVADILSQYRVSVANLVPIVLKRLWDLCNEEDSKPEIESSFIDSDCSNSSWAEMGNYIVGTYEIHPLTKQTKEILILRFLRPVAEYQESIASIYEYKAMDLIFHYMNVRRTNNARLSYEALRFLGSLLFHKKFCLDIVTAREPGSSITGIHKLLKVPRPSLPADGVALCFWYLAYCEDAIEKICLMPDEIVTKMVKYALWLMECSHQSSQLHAIMFFGMVFKFRAMLEIFDKEDGLRILVNRLSTLSLLHGNKQDEENKDEEPNEMMTWQIVRQVFVALENYFQGHIIIKSFCAKDRNWIECNFSHKPINMPKEKVNKCVEFLREYFTAHPHWPPAEQFVELRGHSILLELIDKASNSEHDDIAVNGLSSLYLCSVLPQVQAAFCDKIPVEQASSEYFTDPDPVIKYVYGYKVILDCVEDTSSSDLYGSHGSSSAELQKAALAVLVNCICAPIHKASSFIKQNSSVRTTPTGSKHFKRWTNEDILKNTWETVRASDCILHLTSTISRKVPIMEIDCIRSLACQVLAGLARCDVARQILSKLKLFSDGDLQHLMKEPVLPDKQAEHERFQKHAIQLLERVTGYTRSKQNANNGTVYLANLHKADAVSQTNINYDNKQLLQIVHDHLSLNGLTETASILQKEAELPIVPAMNGVMGPPRINTPSPPLRIRSRANRTFSPLTAHRSPITTQVNSSIQSTSSHNSPISMRINRLARQNLLNGDIVNNGVGAVYSKSADQILPSHISRLQRNEPVVTLDKIICQYFANEHANCENPVVTCPPFDFYRPHRCPSAKGKRPQAINFCLRYMREPYQKYPTSHKKFIYSRYKLSHPLKTPEDNDITVCRYMTDDRHVVVGSNRGDLKVLNKYNEVVIASEPAHQDSISTIDVSHSNNLILTSSMYGQEIAVWKLKSNNLDNMFSLQEMNAEFASSDKMLTTSDHMAKLYDIQKEEIIKEYSPSQSHRYEFNKASIDSNSNLLLTDGVLFDVRSGKEIHYFDKMNNMLNGRFHPTGLEIICSSEIWDLRTYRLLKSVPVLSHCNVTFNTAGDVIFGFTCVNSESISENAFETSFKAVDASDYSSISTMDVKRRVLDLAVNENDTELCIVESDSPLMEPLSTLVRFYTIGMTKADDDEAVEDDDDEDMASGDSSDDDDQEDAGNDTEPEEQIFDNDEQEDMDEGSSDEEQSEWEDVDEEEVNGSTDDDV